MNESQEMEKDKIEKSQQPDEKKSSKLKIEENNISEASKEENKENPTKYGDWQVNGRAIDF